MYYLDGKYTKKYIFRDIILLYVVPEGKKMSVENVLSHHPSVIANVFHRHCERSEAIQAQAVQSGRLSGHRLRLDCFVPRNDDVSLSVH
jgi:hypothetical protein